MRLYRPVGQVELDLIAEKNKAITDDNKEKILTLVNKYKKEE